MLYKVFMCVVKQIKHHKLLLKLDKIQIIKVYSQKINKKIGKLFIGMMIDVGLVIEMLEKNI